MVAELSIARKMTTTTCSFHNNGANFHGWRRVWGEPGENRGGTGGEPGAPERTGENRGHLGREPGENRGLLVFTYKEYRGRSGGFGTRTGGEPGREFSLKQETQHGT